MNALYTPPFVTTCQAPWWPPRESVSSQLSKSTHTPQPSTYQLNEGSLYTSICHSMTGPLVATKRTSLQSANTVHTHHNHQHISPMNALYTHPFVTPWQAPWWPLREPVSYQLSKSTHTTTINISAQWGLSLYLHLSLHDRPPSGH